eukprot:c37297_g1_i1 orf=1-171(-)
MALLLLSINEIFIHLFKLFSSIIKMHRNVKAYVVFISCMYHMEIDVCSQVPWKMRP